MKPAAKARFLSNLNLLKLSAMLAELEVCVRQARESNTGYGEFFLHLIELEVAARVENGRKRRIWIPG